MPEDYMGNYSNTSSSLTRTHQQTEFQENISTDSPQKLLTAFSLAIKDLTNLQISTLVEDEIDMASNPQEFEGQPGKRLVTIIDLLDGDIKNIIGNRFIENDTYASLRQEHAEQVLKGNEIIKGHLENLQMAIQQLIQMGKELKKPD